jgi:hypothetical protein
MLRSHVAALLPILCALSLLGAKEPPPASSKPSGATSSSPASVPATRPVVEMWNGGLYMPSIKPFLLFAAWEDGTVLVRRPLERWSKGPLFIGKAKVQDLEGLLKAADKAGFFDSPIRDLIYVDGPELIITMRFARGETTLRYDDGEPKLELYGPYATPSREQVIAFDKLWRKVDAAIKNLPIAGLSEFKGQPPALKR